MTSCTFQTSDYKNFKVDTSFIAQSEVLKNLLEDCVPSNEIIPIYVPSGTLVLLLDYFFFPTQDHTKIWNSLDINSQHNLVNSANYLEMPKLLGDLIYWQREIMEKMENIKEYINYPDNEIVLENKSSPSWKFYLET